jgi:hypothetical protein
LKENNTAPKYCSAAALSWHGVKSGEFRAPFIYDLCKVSASSGLRRSNAS